MKKNKFHFTVLFIAIVVYLVTAVYSEGYYYPDEHYQIVEFANFKLGRQAEAKLPWEYKAGIRSAIQPTLCYFFLKGFNSMGVTNPYTLAMALRILTALLSLAALFCFVTASLYLVAPRNWYVYILLSYFLWFLPYINVRFSSESWSGDLFLLAVAMILSGRTTKRMNLGMIGVLLGLSFLFRYQSAILSAALLAWLLFVKKEKIGRLAVIVAGSLSMLFLGAVLDIWFYKTNTFTPANYFKVNIMDGAASVWGASPWWFYFWHILHYTLFPIGLLLIVSLLTLLIKSPRNIIVWIVFPFIVLHSIIPHKETRFLFPIANFSALLLVLAWQEAKGLDLVFLRKPLFRSFGYVIAVLLVVINLAGLMALTFKAAGNGDKKITRCIYNEFSGKSVKLFYGENANPYSAGGMLYESFYSNPGEVEVPLNKTDLTDPEKMVDPGKINLLVLRKGDPLNPTKGNAFGNLRLTKLGQSIPGWVEGLGMFYYYPENNKILVLYRIEKN
jgi:phosphatidylinositol glycan class B